MTNAFNLNTFINNKEYLEYGSKSYTPEELAKANMAAQEEERIKQVIKNDSEATKSFLKLTVQGKIKEALEEVGIGDRVIKQVADTTTGLVSGWLNPVADYLEKYEHVYDQNVYNNEMQRIGKEAFLNAYARSSDVEGRAGTGFTYIM